MGSTVRGGMRINRHAAHRIADLILGSGCSGRRIRVRVVPVVVMGMRIVVGWMIWHKNTCA